MTQEWRFTAKSVTKYNPIYRDENGRYTHEEWVGFFQLGQKVNGEVLSFESYLVTENKYVEAVKLFFESNNCSRIEIRSLEKYDFSSYDQNDKKNLSNAYEQISESQHISMRDLDMVIRLILRGIIWAELFCINDESAVVRFGHDFYMYFNSSKNMDVLIQRVAELGLFVE